ncbi:MAG: protein kinase [Chloroflexi bacterium]|nr:protein kinase [Chloroflexota bacterium]
MAKLIQLPGARPADEGEKLVVNYLREQLPKTYTLIPNVEISQRGQPPFEYDIITVAPHAVYVIEVKRWRGGIRGDDHTWIVAGQHRRRSPWPTTNNKARVVKSQIQQRQPSCGNVWVEAVVAIADDRGKLDLQGACRNRVLRYTDLPAFLKDASALGGKAGNLRSKRAYIEKAIQEAARGRPAGPLRFGDYEVLETLSRQDRVAEYLARNVLLRREEPVRLRVFSYDPYLEADELARRQEVIRREAESLQEIGSHPNLITLQGFTTVPDDPNLSVEITEWSEEGTLRELMSADEPLSLERKLELAQGIAAGLKASHDASVIHRDVRPENILIMPDGCPRLMNFDHARLALPYARTVSPIQRDPDVPRAYMAPELLTHQPSPATDVYGLGMILFEMLVGDTLYDSPEEALRTDTSPSGPAAFVVTDIPERLDELVCKMTSIDPSRRPQGADEVLAELHTITVEMSHSAESESVVEPAQEVEPAVFEVDDLIDDRYEVREKLEAGGSGRVYQVYDRIFDDVYALKVFNDSSLSLDFLKQEARSLRAVSHPNIVRVYNWGRLAQSGRLYLVTDFVEGEELTKYTTPDHRLPVREAVNAILGLLSALEALHPDVDRIEALRAKKSEGEITEEEYEEFGRLQSEGWLHRDIKPANLMLTQGSRLKLVDFNIAARASKAGHTQVGTPGYMLPGAGIIPWTTADDLFATGIVLYELVAGHHPYPSCLPNAQDSPADPRQYVPNLRPELARLLTRAVSCDPAQHYHSARRFRQDLQVAVTEAEMNYPHAPDGCTPGECAVFNALRRNLTDGYSVWFEPTLFGEKKNTRPDFTVLGADVGLVTVEVEEAIITGTHKASQDTLTAYRMSQFMQQTNLAQQAESYVRNLMDEIGQYQDTDPGKYQSLLDKTGKRKGKLAVPISALVAFPNITRTAWQSSELRLYDTSDEKSILLRDDLGNTLLERLRDAAAFHGTLSQAQMDTLRWMLYPEARIPSPPEQALTLDPQQIGIARMNTFLPPQAKEIARKPQVRLVRGVVGSGKTLILLLRAKFISEQNPDWRVLVLTYNKSLMKYLRQVFKQIGGDPDRVEIVSFHKWCRDLLPPERPFRNPQDENSLRGLTTNILKEANVTTFDPQFLVEEFKWIKEHLRYDDWEDYLDPKKVKRVGRGRGLGRNELQKRQEIYDLFCRYNERLLRDKMCGWADLPVMVLEAMDKGFIEKAQYHAVLIDEAQDFAPSWFRVAFAMVKPETNMIFIVGDGAQRIYRRDFTWKELGLGITSQNSHVLRRSYRSTREIIDVALEVIRDSPTLIAELRDAGDSLVEPDKEYAEFRHGALPVLLTFESPEKEYAGVAEEVLSLRKQGYLLKDIAVLHRHRDGGEEVARELRRRGVAYSVIKDTQDLTVSAVKICTLHSAKGLEFEIVFVCGLEDFKADEPVDTQSEEFQQLLDQERKLLYVGMTRARQMLYITYSGEGPEWIMERLQHKLKEMQPK